MTATTNLTPRNHHIMTIFTAAIVVALTIVFVFAIASTKASTPMPHLSRANSTLRGEFPPTQIEGIMEQNPGAYVYAGSRNQDPALRPRRR